MKKSPKRQYYKDEKLLVQIGESLRKVRTANKMSIEDLANTIGVDYSQINRMELGKVNFSISNLYRIAKVLEIDPRKLLP